MERELGKDAIECKKIMDLVDEASLKKSVSGFGSCYEKLVKEFIVNIPEDCDNSFSKEFRKKFVRGCSVDFSPEVMNKFLGRNVGIYMELEVTDDQICQEINAQQVRKLPVKGKLLASKPSVKYAMLHRIGAANWVSTNHTSTIAIGLGKFIFVVGTKTSFDFGTYIFEQTMKHAHSFAVKMRIAFPSLICEIILSQNTNILVSSDIACKRESPISLHYKLYQGTHVPDIVITSRNETDKSTTKGGILAEMKEISKALEETIKISTIRKSSMDKLLVALSVKNGEMDKDEAVADKNDGAEGNTEGNGTYNKDEGMADENGDAASNTEEEVAGSTDDKEGNDDKEDSEVEAED